MNITRFSDLALRLLMYLGSRAEPMQATVTVREVATLMRHFSISSISTRWPRWREPHGFRSSLR